MHGSAPAWPTFGQQAELWIKAIEDGRVLHRAKRTRIKPATITGYKSAIEWMSPHIGKTPLANIKNAATKELVTAMKQAELSDKTIVNYIHVLQSHFIGLPVVNPRKQNRPTRTAKEIEKILAAVVGRYRVLYALLAGSGLRIGEALAIRLGPQSDDCSTISEDCSTIYIRQAVWRGKEQDPKTDAAVRDVDLPKELAALLLRICRRPQRRVPVLLHKRQATIITQRSSRQPAPRASRSQAAESRVSLLSPLS